MLKLPEDFILAEPQQPIRLKELSHSRRGGKGAVAWDDF